jgi:hypothetical protein
MLIDPGMPSPKLEENRARAEAEAEPASVERDLECEGAIQLLPDPLAV